MTPRERRIHDLRTCGNRRPACGSADLSTIGFSLLTCSDARSRREPVDDVFHILDTNQHHGFMFQETP